MSSARIHKCCAHGEICQADLYYDVARTALGFGRVESSLPCGDIEVTASKKRACREICAKLP